MKFMRLVNWLPIICLAMLFLLTATPVMADSQPTPTVIATDIDVTDGINSTPAHNTFYAEGRYWEIYLDDDTDLVYTSSATGLTGSWEATQDIVADTDLYGPEVAVWYDLPTNTVHYARHDYDNERTLYRMGTPDTAGDITWAAAEQVVGLTPSNLITFRVNVCVDTSGYPYVAWVDDPADLADNTTGMIYLESSSTKNGTWTENVSTTIYNANYHVWFLQLTPIQFDPYPRMEIEYSAVDISGGIDDGKVRLVAANNMDDFATQVLITTGMNESRPDAFSFNNNHSAAVHGVYCDNATKALQYIARSASENWTEADAPVEILTGSVGHPWQPSLTANGMNLLCIVNNDQILKYATKVYGNAWETFSTIWTVADPDTTAISRHNADYSTGSIITGAPIGFTWQTSTTDLAHDTLYFWWFELAHDSVPGYYPDTSNGLDSFVFDMIPVFVALGFLVYAIVRTRIAASSGNVGGVLIEVVVEGVAILVLTIIITNLING